MGRANGWFAWAFSEVLSSLSPEHPAYLRLLAIHRSHLEALLRYQSPNGMWHQLLDRPDTYEESSATALFVLAFAAACSKICTAPTTAGIPSAFARITVWDVCPPFSVTSPFR